MALPGRTKAVNTPAAVGQCWSTTGDSGSNPAINFLGTTDAQPLVLRTQNVQSLRMEPSTVLSGGNPITSNTVAGSSANVVESGVRGAAIGGGGAPANSDPDIDSEGPNVIADHYSVIGGGARNIAGDQLGPRSDAAFATVAGGFINMESGFASTVGGGTGNRASQQGSTVGGGLTNTASGALGVVGGGSGNTASGDGSVVAGGASNFASGPQSVVGGGSQNLASASTSAIGGGFLNTAAGLASSVTGGSNNCAGGWYSWASGNRAKVRPGTNPGGSGSCSGLTYPGGNGDQGTFVWADSQNANFVSTGPNQFLIRADGGLLFNNNAHIDSADDVTFRARQNSGDADMDLRLVTRSGKSVAFYVSDISGSLFITPPDLTASANRLIVTGGTAGNATLSNGGTWTNASSRNFKEGFGAVDTVDVLNRLLALPITTWQYIGSAEGLHLGPVAEDFKQAFGLAGDGKSIATVDADGVALAAIQGLNAKLEAQNARLSAQNEALLARLEALEVALSEREGR